MLREVKRYIAERNLLTAHNRVLVAVSGGADSVCLLHVLRALGYDLVVAHLHHRIRGADADRDQEWVAETAAALGVPRVLGSRDVPRKARRDGVSLEMAARDARYRFFSRTATRCGADVVATGHTADDQAETILLKLTRGAGATGLSGISPITVMHGIRVVRPLLCIDRGAIVKYLKGRKITWREDASNLDPGFLRNRIRHELLPTLRSRLNPRIRDSLVRTGEILREEDAWLSVLSAEILDECRIAGPDGNPGIDAELLGRHPLAARRRVFRLWLSGEGLSPSLLDFETIGRLEQMLQRRHGSRTCDLADGWTVVRQYGVLTALPKGDRAGDTFCEQVAIPGETLLKQADVRVTVKIGPGVARPKGTRPGQFPALASISYKTLGNNILSARSWLPGDRIYPTGMRGSRKLQDVFCDAKVPRALRRRIPVFVCAGEIVWLPGYRIARGWEVWDPSQQAIQLRLERTCNSRRKHGNAG